jgi:hypothetical protein
MALDKSRRFLPLCLFFIGVSMAFCAWNFIVLPFQNPLQVVGYCTKIQFNPENDLARFLVFVFLPSVLAVVFYNVCGAAKRAEHFGQKIKGSELGQPLAVSISRRGGISLLLLVYAVLLAINTPTYHAFGRFDSYHEGESLGSAISYLAGQQPYRDFVFFHGLIQDPLRSAWAFQIFGKSIGAERTFESLAKVVLWLLLAVFLDRLFRKKTWITFLALSFLAVLHVSFFFNVFGTFLLPSLSADSITDLFLDHRSFWENFNFLILTARDGLTFAFLWIFLEVHGFLVEGRSAGKWRKRFFFFLLAFVPVSSLGYSIDRGVYLAATYCFLAPVLFFFFTRTANLRKNFLLFSVSGILTAFLLLEWLLKGRLLECLRFIFIVFPSYKALSEKIPFPIEEWKFLFALILVSGQVYLLTWKVLGARYEIGETWKTSFFGKNLAEMVLALLSVFYFFNVLVRSDEEHLLYGLGVPYILAFFILFRRFEPFLKEQAGVKKVLKSCVVFSVAAIFAAGVIRDVRWNAFQKNFPLGTTDDDFISSQDRAAVLFLKGKMGPDDQFFTMTSEASWYYYLDKPCPTRFPYIWTAAPEVFQREINQDLSLKKVKWVLFRDDDWSGRIDGISNEEKFPVVAQFIRKNYHPFQNVEGREIWVLNGS